MKTIKPVLLINLSANNGKAQKVWNIIENDVMRRMPAGTEVCKYHVPLDLNKQLENWIKSGVTCFVIGGGDGSINYILNLIIGIVGKDLPEYVIGAIGLGSSNDFHKPFSTRIKGAPLKINLNAHQLVDLGSVKYLDSANARASRFFIINASIGVTAEANLLFNSGDMFINYMKSRHTNLTILYTAIKSIYRYRNINGILDIGGDKTQTNLSNLAVLKKPHVSGSFRFDQQIKMNDSMLGLNACINMGKLELIKTLADLSRGRFSGKKNRITAFTKKVGFYPDCPVALETDGEVTLAKNIVFEVIPKAIQILNN